MVDYAYISQSELRDILNRHGMKTTSQTLRTWERHSIILAPDRKGKIMGRDAWYSEFALAECFAAHHLIKGDLSLPSDLMALVPKFSLRQVGTAANAWRKSGNYYIEGYPAPPIESYAMELPPQKVTKAKKLFPLQVSDNVWGNPAIKEKTVTVRNAFDEFSMAAWIWAVSIGCELLLGKYRNK